jgi:type II secretory pathway pseudopilin PulG
MNKPTRGFTVIELIIVISVLIGASVLFFMQKNDLEIIARDKDRKTSINAIYYSLEEVFYKENQYYPQSITAETLPSVDPELLKDPEGNVIGTAESSFIYEPTNCKDAKCQSYTLRTPLEHEDDFVKQSRNN